MSLNQILFPDVKKSNMLEPNKRQIGGTELSYKIDRMKAEQLIVASHLWLKGDNFSFLANLTSKGA
jgi:hypothetical protein